MLSVSTGEKDDKNPDKLFQIDEVWLEIEM